MTEKKLRELSPHQFVILRKIIPWETAVNRLTPFYIDTDQRAKESIQRGALSSLGRISGSKKRNSAAK